LKRIDINTWNRKEHFKHFSDLKDPYFAVTIPFNVTKVYQFSKANNLSFFVRYLHDCMRAINAVENLKYRVVDGNLVEFDNIHASATLIREDNTFGFSFIEFDDDIKIFTKNFELEKDRIKNSSNLYPERNSLDCIHCSALPWLNFSGHKEPSSNVVDSVPKLAFSKVITINNEMTMNVSISVNHALVDGFHVGLFAEKFQKNLNE